MKIVFTALLGLFCLNDLYAQIQKGNGILSGTVSVAYDRQTRPFSTILNTGPTSVQTNWMPALAITAGRFWKDNWLAGVSLSGSLTRNQQNLESNTDRTYPNTFYSIFVTPFIRRYWQVGSVYVFGGVGVSVSTSGSRRSYFDSDGQLKESGERTKTMGIAPRVEAGINYLVSSRLGIQLLASTNSLPLSTAGLSAGLVYWTGPGRMSNAQEQRDNPQTNAGKWVLEGGFSVTNQQTNQDAGGGITAYQSRTNVCSFSPSIGYFIGKNKLIGVSIPIAYSGNHLTSTNASASKDMQWTVGVVPYFQHYWLPTQLTPYTRIEAGYMHYTSEDYSGFSVNGAVRVGLAYMIGQRFILETSLAGASVSYRASGRSDRPGDAKTWNGGVSAGLTGNFALRYVL
ncbi:MULTISPECIES: hypothetical protein [unclassified Spirosoma]|uniref:hypothetical protein n=1 Tax=unclassified Spirosoma TaxID=2621999 RepID=UPI0009658BA5|nr:MULTISPECIES: hypothetical protein [unclassified Spirosoma]MBN8821085.1 hypothetical protein [Spirosoma sp.]OJW79276.1 MAG: hypothetical protein BGO59_12095 [Spirosoma sp. 48-14]